MGRGMVKEGMEGKNKQCYQFLQNFGRKEGRRARGLCCITSKSGTKKFKTELLLGFLDGKAYICSVSLSRKIILGEMEFNMIGEKESKASLCLERLYYWKQGIRYVKNIAFCGARCHWHSG